MDSEKSYDRSQLRKTEWCQMYKETGECQFGKRCWYAHGNSEIRSRPRNRNYKTQLCYNYHTRNKVCHFGSKCQYIHEELKPTNSIPLADEPEIWQDPRIVNLHGSALRSYIQESISIA